MNYTIQEIQKQEYPLLHHFLYEAIFVPDGEQPPPRTILSAPELQVYVAGFGESADDLGLVARADGRVIGAVWARIMNDYGHVDDETPSLAISLYKEYRGLGIGTALLKEMLVRLKARGYRRVSLSVQKANGAARLYQRLGFQIIAENCEEFIMRKELSKESVLRSSDAD